MYKIFVSAMAFDDGKSGISNYIENAVYNLAKTNIVYVAILQKDINNFKKKHENIVFIPFADFFGKSIINFIFHLFILPFFVKKECDFIFLPAGNRRLMFYYPKFTITTFHDLSQFYVSNKYDKLRMFYIKKIIPLFLKKVHKIVCVSENTKKDLIKIFNIPLEKLSVVENGFDKELFDLKKSTNFEFKKQYNINKEYFLYVARIEHPGKNHINLVKAYENLDDKIKQKYDLVFIGQEKENAQVVLDYINSSKDKNSIKILGFVENEHLKDFYFHAKMFIFPSLYEGFGIPLIEAMASGIPTACAKNSSLQDIGSGVSMFFNEKKISSITNSIKAILSDESLQKSMIESGLEKVKKYDWRTHAKSIISIYEER